MIALNSTVRAQSDSIDFRHAFDDVTTLADMGCIGLGQRVHVDDRVHYSTVVTCSTIRIIGCGNAVHIAIDLRIYTRYRDFIF